MTAEPTPRPASNLPALLVLAALLFAGNFLFARLFGIYDDDFIFTAAPFGWSWADAWAHIVAALREWPQGRPVGFALTHLLSYLSAQSSSLGLGYLIGYGILLLNAALLHSLARRLLPAPAALLVAAVYVLYPADTAKAILMHRVFLQLNLTFLLLALLCYGSGRRRLAYLIAPLCFLTYEPVFIVFLLAPLLVASPKEFSWKRGLLHGLLCTATIAVLLLLRREFGDQRVAETFGDPLETVRRILQALYIGPKTVLTALVDRPIEALGSTDALVWIVVLLCGGAFFAVARSSGQSPDATAPAPRIRALWIAGVGAVGLLLGYALCFRVDYWPPIMTIGRLSGYHAAGSIGAALLVGGLFAWALESGPRFHRWLIAAAALYCGLLVSFGIEVQRIDYVQHAEQQTRYWRAIIDTSGEWTPNTVILVDISGNDPGRPCTPGLPVWWTVNFAPTFLEKLVAWPAAWSPSASAPDRPGPAAHPIYSYIPYFGSVSDPATRTPRVFGFLPSFETIAEGEAVTVKVPTWLGPAFWPHIRDQSFIFFRFAGGRMVRAIGPVQIGDRKFQPLAPPLTLPPSLPTKPLYELLFARETDWQTILQSRNYPR